MSSGVGLFWVGAYCVSLSSLCQVGGEAAMSPGVEAPGSGSRDDRDSGLGLAIARKIVEEICL